MTNEERIKTDIATGTIKLEDLLSKASCDFCYYLKYGTCTADYCTAGCREGIAKWLKLFETEQKGENHNV